MSPVESSRLSSRLNDLRAHVREPLYRNAYALMLNTAVSAGLGAIASVVMTHNYTVNQVGYGAALVAAMQLLSAVTQLNFATVLLRFLPRAGRLTNHLLLSAYGISIACAVVVTTVVLLIASVIAPDTHPLNMSLRLGTAFVLATAAYSIFNLQDAALTGLRRTIWVPFENGIFGLAKIFAMIVFAGSFGALGIFTAWAIPLAAMLIPVNFVIFRYFVRRHKQLATGGESAVQRKVISRFIAGDYLGSVFIQATTTLLPLLVISTLGEVSTGYFVTAQTVATTLDLILINLSASFTVEAAHDESKVGQYARQILWYMARLIVPLVVVVYIGAPYLMQIFDTADTGYREHSTTLLRLLALSSLPKMFSAVYGALARLEHKTHKIAIMTALQAGTLTGGSLLLMPHVGVNGVGLAALAAQVITAVVIVPSMLRYIRTPPPPNAAGIAR